MSPVPGVAREFVRHEVDLIRAPAYSAAPVGHRLGHRLAARLGATPLEDGQTCFLVWVPYAQSVAVHLVAPNDRLEPLQPLANGYYGGTIADVGPGARYFYRLNGEKERTDPASRLQPEGVHGPSAVVAPDGFPWTDDGWFGRPLRDYVIYELHVGTYTAEGTFEAVISHLDELVDLGVTAIEIMPVAQFPGDRNWGYDGAYPFAVQISYGGPDGLRRLVNTAHDRGLSVILDVVYNHLGPEGNYLGEYGPYFTDRYRTPWGAAINYDGPASDDVRRYFVENALQWLNDFHIDALRLDAVHAITDFSAVPFLEELQLATSESAERANRRFYLIAESDLNDARLIRPHELGGYGLAGQWADDLHHALHALLTGERSGYYADFGSIQHVVDAYRDGYAYAGMYSAYRQRRHGNSPRLNGAEQFVVCTQNHDQVGNRMLGDRLATLLRFEDLKLAAGAMLLSPYLPLLFMGEEYGEIAPFLYFVSHGDPDLVAAVRRGRAEEFAGFRDQGEPPDPADVATFERSRLHHELRGQGHHHALHAFYKELIRLRRTIPALAHLSKDEMDVTGDEAERLLLVQRWHGPSRAYLAINFGDAEAMIPRPRVGGSWTLAVNSADAAWDGPGHVMPPSADFTAAGQPMLPGKTLALYIENEEAAL
jgi:maltooligosyltrehalose trehalohydrolase